MSLDKLLKLQAQKKDSESGGIPTPTPAATPEPTTETTTAPAESESTPAPNPKRLPFGNQPAKPKPTMLNVTAEMAAKDSAARARPKLDLSLDNLGSFDLSDADEPETPVEAAGFFDEIEATAPDRELPEGMTPDMEAFVENLNSIYLILNDAGMFAQSIRTIMMELQENPEYEKLISDTDVHVMIRAMRNTMGLARIRKQAKTRKPGVTKSRSPSKKQQLMDKALGLSINIGMDID